MRKDFRRLIMLVAGIGSLALAVPLPAAAKQSCAKRIAAAEKAYFNALLGKATNACRKAPGTACFAVTAKGVPSGKKLKQCSASDITAAFNGKCVSRDASCVPATLATPDDAAKCVACQVKGAVTCLVASAFAPAHLPTSGCLGSPSGAFLDSYDDIPSQPAASGSAR